MKYLAHREPEGKSRPITIYDVIKGRNGDHPEDWEEGKIYYSLWYYTPMKAVVNVTKRTPHFAFIDGAAAGHQEGGESLEHSLSKKIVSELKELKISVYGRSYQVPVRSGKIEHPETFRDRNYKIDVLLEAGKCSFTEEYGSNRIGVEIKKSNKVKSRKKNHIRNLPEQMILLEISLWDQIKLNEAYDVERLYNGLMSYWNKERKASFLHNPNHEEGFKKHQERKEEEREKQLEERRRSIVQRPIVRPEPVKISYVSPRPIEPQSKPKKKFNKLPLIVLVMLVIAILFVLFKS